jgi:hypothetical protein
MVGHQPLAMVVGLCPHAAGRKMRKNQRRFLWLGVSILGVLTVSPALLGQASPESAAAAPVISDWSHNHLIFSKPATAEQARQVERDPRYWQQQFMSSSRQRAAEAGGARAPEGYSSKFAVSSARHRGGGGNSGIDKDWSLDLGTGASVGATNYPAKVAFRGTNAVCGGGATQPDFVVYGTGLTGSATQANIVAFDNLYSGCVGDGTVPTVYWAYDANGGTVTTSPVLSSDATQVAFVQADSAGNGVLVLLKWAASSGTLGSPIALTRVRNDQYPACVAPCMTSTLIKDSSGRQHPDTNSSVFYDYSSDTAYVGDDAGWIHQVNPVFNGIPAEVRSAGWPVQVNTGNPTALNSPVYDPVSAQAFVTDVGGFLYRVGPTSAAVATTSGPLDVSFAEDGGFGFVQGAIVDSTAELVYVFASSDGSTACTGGAACAAVYQLHVDFASGTSGTKVKVGASTVNASGTAPNPLFIGAFDSTYENSVDATGNLYVCGNTGGDPTLYQVPITAGAFGTAIPGPTLSIIATPCSPVTDLMNPNASGGATERLFVSAEADGVSSGCALGGCIFNFKDTPWQTLTVYTAGQEILDSHFQVQAVVSVTGISGAIVPSWATTAGSLTTDGTVIWVDQGVQSAVTPGAWVHGHQYTNGSKIIDGNNNVQLVTTGGTSGGSMPTFNAVVGGTTHDGTGLLVWTNVGPPATAAMAAGGGTSGIIVDNIVGSGTLAGASQVYFSTLQDQACGTSGTGGCAVQASQSALQ